jgi:hypothetical protein
LSIEIEGKPNHFTATLEDMAGQGEENLEMDGDGRWTLVRVRTGIKHGGNMLSILLGFFFNRRTWAGSDFGNRCEIIE